MAAKQFIKSQDDLNEYEAQWRAALAGRSLVIEANAQPDVAAEALAVLGFNYGRLEGRADRARLLERYRAALVVGVCTTATKYDVGGMWPYLAEAFGEIGQIDQQVISEAFRASLDHFRLSRFEFPRRNVDEILMHAGIPGQRMDEFIELLADRDARTPALDGAQFCAWLSSVPIATATNYHRLDTPTYRFLTHGREIAEDVVDRCLELLDAWREDSAKVNVSAFPTVMQPDLLRALQELGEKVDTRTTRRRDRRVSTVPFVAYSRQQGVTVQLPSLEIIADQRIDWLIAFEGSVTRRTLEPPWPGDLVSIEHVPVTRPAREISLRAEPGNNEWTLRLVDPDDPLLVFDGTTGQLVPARSSLPQSDVLIAVPNPDAKTFDELVEIEGRSPTLQLIEAPLGWGLWSFYSTSLNDVSRLRMSGAELWRSVSTVRRPAIQGVGPLPYLRASDGGTVWAAPPLVTLPGLDVDTAEGAVVPWTIGVLDLARSEEVLRQTWEVGRQAVSVDLADTSLARAVGEFEISVKGPLGRGVTRRFTIATGISVEADRDFRVMSPFGDGLVNAEVLIKQVADDNDEFRVELDPTTTSAVHVLTRGLETLDVTTSIAAMSVTVQIGDELQPVSHGPVRLDVEDLHETTLRVSVGAPGAYELVGLNSGELLQTVRANAVGASNTVRFALAQLVDTFTAVGGGQLVLAYEGSRIPVGHVRPRQLAQALEFDGADLVLRDCATDEPLELAIYPRYAPWVPPTTLTAINGRVPLPEILLGEGKGRAILRTRDPWVEQPWPADYPSRGANVFDLDLGEVRERDDDEMVGFRSWLARTGRCPSVAGRLAPAIWLYTGRHLEKYRTPADTLRHELAAQIALHRGEVPGAFLEATVSDAPVELFVAAELVKLPPGSYVFPDALWEISPLLAAMASDWTDMVTIDRAVRVLGEGARSILEGDGDSHSALGRFGDNELLISRWPDDRIEAVWRSVDPVPGRLLDPGTRQIAAKQLFDRRETMPLDLKGMAHQLSQISDLLVRAVHPGTETLLAARRGSHGWTTTPELSLALALLARADARGHERVGEIYAHFKPMHEGLARVAPLMTEQDVILAELWLTRWSNE